MKYIEMGIGNKDFVSTEVENGEYEYRVKGRLNVGKRISLYIRIWIGKYELILDTLDIVKFKVKNESKLKIIGGSRHE